MSKKEYDFLASLALIVWFSLYLNALPRPNTQITYWDVYWEITEGIFFNIYCALSGLRQFKRFVTEQEAIVSSELLPIRCILRRIITIIKYTQTHLCTKVQNCTVNHCHGGGNMYLSLDQFTNTCCLINVEIGSSFVVKKDNSESNYRIEMHDGKDTYVIDNFSKEDLVVAGCDMEKIEYRIPELLLSSLEGSHNKEELLEKFAQKAVSAYLQE